MSSTEAGAACWRPAHHDDDQATRPGGTLPLRAGSVAGDTREPHRGKLMSMHMRSGASATAHVTPTYCNVTV